MHPLRLIIASALLATGASAAPTVAAAPVPPDPVLAPAADPDPNTYPIVLGGDFTADGVGDLFFHSPSSAPDLLYDFNPTTDPGDGLDIYQYSAKGSYRPVVGRFGNDRSDDILWYQPGSGADVIWDLNPCGFCPSTPTYTRMPISVNGTYTPVAGRFTANLRDDVIWYGEGTRADSMWDFNAPCGSCQSVHTSRSLTINGRGYRPVAGNFIGDPGGVDDVFWYNPNGPESMWVFGSGASYRSINPSAIQVSGRTYKLAVADLFGDAADDIVFLGPGTAQDSVWDFYDDALSKFAAPEPIGGAYSTIVGVPDGANTREPGGYNDDFFVYDPAGTAGRYFDIYYDETEQAVFYARYDFDPVPLTELPPGGAGAAAAAPEGRRWAVPMRAGS